MRSDDNKKKTVSESRKVRKPLMEKKRRARINESLETLKQILLDSKTPTSGSSDKKTGQRSAKLEKADILEMTVQYVQQLRNQLDNLKKSKPTEETNIRGADSSSDELKMDVTLIPTKLRSGEIVFVMPSNLEKKPQILNKVWRPWN